MERVGVALHRLCRRVSVGCGEEEEEEEEKREWSSRTLSFL